MAGAAMRQMAYDDRQFSLLPDFFRRFKIPKSKTDSATPIKPARNTSKESRANQVFPKEMKRITPIRNAQRSEILEIVPWMFI
jgi:hypothetical protein